MYMLSFLTLVSDGIWLTQAEKFPTLTKSDVNLFNHLSRKADMRVVVLRFVRWMARLPVFSVTLICIV